ncbi:MAG TPA: hypothetical protein VI168_14890 [Croceibacterium sp.]
MSKLFYGSYVICALLALLQLVMFFSAYLHGDMAIYHRVILLTAGTTSLILVASILFTAKAKIIAMLMFAVSAISSYVWEMSIRPIDPTRMSFSDGLVQGLIFLIFIFVPILGLVSGASLLGEMASAKSRSER